MPTYDYECNQCAENHRIQHAMSAEKPACPSCGGELTQVFLVAPAVNGAGSGASDFDAPACEAPMGACGTGMCPAFNGS